MARLRQWHGTSRERRQLAGLIEAGWKPGRYSTCCSRTSDPDLTNLAPLYRSAARTFPMVKARIFWRLPFPSMRRKDLGDAPLSRASFCALAARRLSDVTSACGASWSGEFACGASMPRSKHTPNHWSISPLARRIGKPTTLKRR